MLKLRAAPAAKDVLDAIEVLRGMNSDNARKVPADAPTEFIKPRWQKLVMTDTGIDRRYYELCALSEMKNALRSGDIWVQGSRQFKDFEDYLVPPAKFASLKQASELPLAVATDCNRYLNDRLTLLETQLATVNRMATAPPHRRTARTSAPAARPRAPATSTRNTGAAQGGRSTPTFLTSTRHFTPRS